MGLTITAIVCAYNEARYLPACLFSLLSQTRPPDEILVVNNASTDDTAARASEVPGARVIEERDKGLVIARETARREARGDILVYTDADCRAPIFWLEVTNRSCCAISTSIPVGAMAACRFEKSSTCTGRRSAST